MSRRYTAVRGLARFTSVRAAVTAARHLAQRRVTAQYIADRETNLPRTRLDGLDRAGVDTIVAGLRTDGLAQGLRLAPDTVAAVVDFAEHALVYADREVDRGFRPHDRPAAEATLGKPILVAQYFNSQEECPEIGAIATDPALELIAARFLGSVPRLVGSSLWWTFPVDATEADRNLHAHLFHRDVDDFAFLKFFFYLTPVAHGDGAHVCVLGSHDRPAADGLGERLRLRRYSDDEIAARFAPDRILEICGRAGEGFAENTLCVHKGLTPTRTPRLLLQFEFALFDHGVMHDRRPSGSLRMLPIDRPT